MLAIEADVFVIDGDLKLGHNPELYSNASFSLDNVYLRPLAQMVTDRGGRLYPAGGLTGYHGPAFLVLDSKVDDQRRLGSTLSSEQAWDIAEAKLRALSFAHPGLLTEYGPEGMVTQGAITVLLSGDRPRAPYVLAKGTWILALDGRGEDVAASVPRSLNPMVSEDLCSGALGAGPDCNAHDVDDTGMLERVRTFVDGVHKQGKLVRFFSHLDEPAGWRWVWGAGADFISTDHPAAMQAWVYEQLSLRGRGASVAQERERRAEEHAHPHGQDNDNDSGQDQDHGHGHGHHHDHDRRSLLQLWRVPLGGRPLLGLGQAVDAAAPAHVSDGTRGSDRNHRRLLQLP
ncbi:hypothetical protein FOA52_010169 [Chlamydomonas sp. UWO 241]|nr:hypothetical protein FOA52_010169 [Chlamydomonas sp. UWO 241]